MRDYTGFPQGIQLSDLEDSRVTILQYVDGPQQEPDLPGRWLSYRSGSQDVDLRLLEKIDGTRMPSQKWRSAYDSRKPGLVGTDEWKI